MSVEIGEPLQRERSAEKEDLPAIAGCGYKDPNFDPVAAWKARQAAKPEQKVEQGSLMPCVEAMPNWRSFVGWVEPSTSAPKEPQSVEEAVPLKPAPQAILPEDTAKPSPIREEVSFEAPDDGATSITLADFDEPSQASAAPAMNLGDLDMDSIIQAAAESVDLAAEAIETEPAAEPSATSEASASTMVVMLDEPGASLDFESEPEPEPMHAGEAEPLVSSPPQGMTLAPKLAGVRPLAHPGRLPRGFDLSAAEKGVLRKCNGQQTTQAIFDSGIELDGDALTAFLKRCAKVKLITFKK